MISSNIARGNAIDALTSSETQLTDAHASFTSANTELDEAAAGALTVYTESGEFVKVVRADLLADAATLDELNTARAELADTAGLVVDGDTATAPTIATVEPEGSAGAGTEGAPTTLEAMAEQTEANLQQAKTYSQDADKARATADEIADQQDAIGELTETVVSSGAEFGAAVTGMDKAEASTTASLTAAVTALADTDTPAIGRFATYVAAYDAVKKSHDDTVAAEQAAAEEAARQEQARQSTVSTGGSSSNGSRGGSSGSTGSGSTGSSSSGGGSTGGSNAGGSNSGGSSSGGYADPNANKTPATFERGANYIAYDASRCGFYSSHQVGYGGTSLGGRTLDKSGALWSATVSGDTVTFYICL